METRDYTDRAIKQMQYVDIALQHFPSDTGQSTQETFPFTYPSQRTHLLSDAVKRAFDVFASLVAIVVFLLPCLLVALLIYLEDRGTPIFKQTRIGKNGVEFTLLKFRSMRIDAEEDGKPKLCSEDDSRLTRIGAFLRRHHLDELPQLWNVLVGDMSFVGYRPERQYFIDLIFEQDFRYISLFAIRPGLFSEATLYNGYTDTMEKMLTRLRMDLDYLERRSLWLDITIIYKTAMSIISGKEF